MYRQGKVHKHHEFGCKVRVVTTVLQSWIVGIDAVHGNPYDGATLKPALAQVKKLTGVRPQQAFVNKGFRGQRHHPKAVAVYISGQHQLAPRLGKSSSGARPLSWRSAIPSTTTAWSELIY